MVSFVYERENCVDDICNSVKSAEEAKVLTKEVDMVSMLSSGYPARKRMPQKNQMKLYLEANVMWKKT